MATQTENLGLSKPDTAEGYDVAVFNANADAIDNAIGALLNNSGVVGEKVDAVKTDTEEIKSIIGSPTDTTGAFTLYGQIKVLTAALTTANQNIATLLTQRGSVKRLYNGTITSVGSSGGQIIVAIPSDMNQEKCIVFAPGGVSWHKNGANITFSIGAGATLYYQIMELY